MNRIYLDTLNAYNLEKVRIWRNFNLEALRTSKKISCVQQQNFYENVICNKNSEHKYFGIFLNENAFIGMTGLTYIQWENGIAEISLIISPDYTENGYGKESVDLILTKAFKEMRLNNVYGEVYECNKAIEFWKKIITQYNAYSTILPNRKFWNGRYNDSLYFNINYVNFSEVHND